VVAAEGADDLGIERGIFFDEVYYTDVLTGAVRARQNPEGVRDCGARSIKPPHGRPLS
jgi:hypothetical protein